RWEVIFDPARLEARLAEIEVQANDPGFWSDQERAQAVQQERAQITETLEELTKLKTCLGDAETLLEMISESEEADLVAELESELERAASILRKAEMARMLTGEHDARNAILEINAGAGGTEAQDWAEMLLRMYMRWAEKKQFRVEILDQNQADEAGIKSATLLVSGQNAFGYLRSERGVHRLVRISPFDTNSKRHTSFASIAVMPEVSDDIDIDIADDEIRIDTYRASGAGGQHVNKTDSAVRITHLETNIVVSCQSLRSQHKNKDQCMKMLKAKLYERELEKKRQAMAAIAGTQMRIDFGSQIRNYVMQPYQMVKDVRTNVQAGDVGSVLDGDIDIFIEAYLMSPEFNIS
ncbi:UNVERIFIED_CONTAM: hypothetical protein GTU68_065226, partial [Idotea baltica]|nr:hypothetical protein [Idotea baltica]